MCLTTVRHPDSSETLSERHDGRRATTRMAASQVSAGNIVVTLETQVSLKKLDLVLREEAAAPVCKHVRRQEAKAPAPLDDGGGTTMVGRLREKLGSVLSSSCGP